MPVNKQYNGHISMLESSSSWALLVMLARPKKIAFILMKTCRNSLNLLLSETCKGCHVQEELVYLKKHCFADSKRRIRLEKWQIMVDFSISYFRYKISLGL